MTARYIVGDVRDVLATLPDHSVDLVFTSPPFLALRSYLPADHDDKHQEIGSEPDPGAFIDTLLGVTEDLARVLTRTGSLCVELGDTYSGSGGAGGDYNKGGLRDGQARFKSHRKSREDWPEAKSACMIPELFRISLAYGRNPLTGRPTPRWKVRNTVRWCRPNPPVGALGDKFRPATSELVIACKAKDRFFDLDAVRHANPRSEETYARRLNKGNPGYHTGDKVVTQQNPAGAPPLDWWKIPTAAYRGSHYATFPPALVDVPLRAMCPQRVCMECGEPSRRIVKAAAAYADHLGSSWADRDAARGKNAGTDRNRGSAQPAGTHLTSAQYDTLGWTDCGHDAWRTGIVLDPFAGTGTVGLVAENNGRDSVLIDFDERNVVLARERIGMMLEAA